MVKMRDGIKLSKTPLSGDFHRQKDAEGNKGTGQIKKLSKWYKEPCEKSVVGGFVTRGFRFCCRKGECALLEH